MSAAEIRAELHQLIDQLDERFLKAVHSMVSTYQSEEDEIVGYRIDSGEPIYESKLGEELDAIVEEVENGDYITLEDLKRESEEW
jgi:hypothetical protein